MNILAPLPLIMSGQDNFLRTEKADAMWEELCNNFFPDQPFTIDEAVAKCSILRFAAPATRRNYMRTIVRAVIADHAFRPADYDGHTPIRAIGTARNPANGNRRHIQYSL